MDKLSINSELKDTVDYMVHENYKYRFIGEYYQLLIRLDRLEKVIFDAYSGQLKTQCPIKLLELQAEVMQHLLNILTIMGIMVG